MRSYACFFFTWATNFYNFILSKSLGDDNGRTMEVSCHVGHTPSTQKELLLHNNPHMALGLKSFQKRK